MPAGLRQQAEQLAATLPPLLVAAERVAATVAQGVHGRRRVGQGESFWQFRQYQPGDEVRAIDWRATAKTERVFVREHEWEAAQSVWLWPDASPSMHYASAGAPVAKVERATLLTLALAALLLRSGEFVGLLGVDRVPTSGRAALARLAASLHARAGAGPSLPPAEPLPRYARVVLIGDFLSPVADIEECVRHFAANAVDGHLLQLLDPAEEDLPFTGRTRFEGLEGEPSYLVSRAETLRQAYGARLAAHHEDLLTLSRGVGWTLARHRTDRAPETALLALYQALAGKE